MVTAIGSAETGLGGDTGPAGKMTPATNPMQLVAGANMNLNHNIDGAMGVLDWAQRKTGNGSIGWEDYYYYSGGEKNSDPENTMSNFLNGYNSLTEQEQ
jgi:hypothetical protein